MYPSPWNRNIFKEKGTKATYSIKKNNDFIKTQAHYYENEDLWCFNTTHISPPRYIIYTCFISIQHNVPLVFSFDVMATGHFEIPNGKGIRSRHQSYSHRHLSSCTSNVACSTPPCLSAFFFSYFFTSLNPISIYETLPHFRWLSWTSSGWRESAFLHTLAS